MGSEMCIRDRSEGYDDIVIRGDIKNSQSFAAFYFNDEKLLAVDAVNSPREFMLARMTLSKSKSLDKRLLVDSEMDLKLIRPV